MRLTKIQIKNYRSIHSEGEGTLDLDLTDGMNVLIGQNNCGKSNLLSGLALAMDPDHGFNRDRDMPAAKAYAYPRVTLHFTCEGRTGPEKTLLRYAEEYEKSVIGADKSTYAASGELRFVVTYPGNQSSGATRREFFQARGAGNRSEDSELSSRLIKKFRETCRFVLVRSGESLESLLSGRFRDILHMVIREHLASELSQAETERREYVEALQKSLLSPLEGRIDGIIRNLFPEMCGTVLLPQVPTIDDALSNVRISLADSAETELSSKGTGVRGGVLVAMLRYLAETSRRSIVLAVEEPEAFLHPSAQESLRADLEKLADKSDISLLVTTHSPFIVSPKDQSQVVSLVKDPSGKTIISGTARGSEPNSALLGSLFRDSAVADMLARASSIPGTARAVLVVEGATDEKYLRIACEKCGRADLLDRIHISPAGGANNVVVQSILLRSHTTRPVLSLFDSDECGRAAKKKLCSLIKSGSKKEILEYGHLTRGNWQEVEAEDLWPWELLDRFVADSGESALQEKSHRKDGGWHIGLSYYGKSLIVDWLRANASESDCSKWVEVAESITKVIDNLA